jgi:hypothetical protein
MVSLVCTCNLCAQFLLSFNLQNKHSLLALTTIILALTTEVCNYCREKEEGQHNIDMDISRERIVRKTNV